MSLMALLRHSANIEIYRSSICNSARMLEVIKDLQISMFAKFKSGVNKRPGPLIRAVGNTIVLANPVRSS